MKNTIALLLFLLVVYGATVALVGALVGGVIPTGGGSTFLGLLVQLALVGLPGAAVLGVVAITGDTDRPHLRIWPLNPMLVLAIAVTVPVFFAILHGAGVLVGAATPDWSVTMLQSSMPPPQEVGLTEPLPASFLALAGLLISMVLGPTFFALLALPTEFAWRAYATEKLAPLGRWGAACVSSLLWALSIVPLAYWVGSSGGASTGEMISLVGRVFVAAILFGMILAEVYRRTRHVGITAVAAGCFYAQGNGIWSYLAEEMEPWAVGPTGAIGIVCLALLMLALYFIPSKGGPEMPPAAAGMPSAH